MRPAESRTVKGPCGSRTPTMATVSRVDPGSGAVIETIQVGGKPVGIAVGDGFVWVTVQAT